jgi:putative glutamine amidotransferase
MTVRIGITCSNPSWPDTAAAQARLENYRLALEQSGARGEFLFLDDYASADAARLATELDGLLLSGGADLSPELYGEAPREGANLDIVTPARPALEFALVEEFAKRAKPILGICYGCQFLNVWAGGGLLQDIELQWPQAIAHRAAPAAPHIEARHEIHIASGSALARILDVESADVNSFHHQGVARVAPPDKVQARAVAEAPDGIIEAIEFGTLEKGDWMLGVQWHPERDRDSDVTQRLFDSFVSVCR